MTMKFKGLEGEILEKMVDSGLFATKSEAVRSALVHLALDLDLFRRKQLWKEIQRIPRRKVSPKQLARELEALEDEGG